MIRLELDGTKYHVEWEHSGPAESPNHTVCVCRIYEQDLQEPTYRGAAILHPNDRYIKETGRKISLAKAMKNWPRSKRVEVWKAYFSRKKS